VPAAAVIPAPIAYIKVAAVKKLVGGSGQSMSGAPYGATVCSAPPAGYVLHALH
jgi:hypothetical protein